MDELEKEPVVKEAYACWYELREEVLRSYRDDLPERLPLSRQKEFKNIKNLVIRQAMQLGKEIQEEAESLSERAGPDLIPEASTHTGWISRDRYRVSCPAECGTASAASGKSLSGADSCFSNSCSSVGRPEAETENTREEKSSGTQTRRPGDAIERRNCVGGILYYGKYTREQIDKANQVDLEELLRRQGEKLIRSGRDHRLEE